MHIGCLAFLMVLATAVPAPPAGPPEPFCNLETTHPIQIQVRLLDATAPGRWLRAEARIQSALDLSDLAIELQADPSVELAGSRKASWATLAAEEPRELGFDVRLPDVRAPLQVRVLVRGRAGDAWLERGAVLQLLPRGRHHVPVSVETTERAVLEYRGAARRQP